MILSISIAHSTINFTLGQHSSIDNLNDNLILYLPMSQGEGEVAYDYVGDANGDIFGADWYFDDTYTALQFDGVSDYVRIKAHPLIKTNEMTISVFVNYYQIAGGWSNCIITQDDLSQTAGYIRYQLSTFDGHVTWIPMGKHLFSNDLVETNIWYHIVTTFDDQYHSLWLNGVLQSEVTGSFPNIEAIPTDIGRKNIEEENFYFDGLIDDVKIYDRALDEEEINQLFIADHGGTVEFDDSNPAANIKSYQNIYVETDIPNWVKYGIFAIVMTVLVLMWVNTVIYFRKNSMK